MPPPPEPTAYELGTLGGLSDLVNENFKEFDRERKITLRAIAENAPQMVAAPISQRFPRHWQEIPARRRPLPTPKSI